MPLTQMCLQQVRMPQAAASAALPSAAASKSEHAVVQYSRTLTMALCCNRHCAVRQTRYGCNHNGSKMNTSSWCVSTASFAWHCSSLEVRSLPALVSLAANSLFCSRNHCSKPNAECECAHSIASILTLSKSAACMFYTCEHTQCRTYAYLQA